MQSSQPACAIYILHIFKYYSTAGKCTAIYAQKCMTKYVTTLMTNMKTTVSNLCILVVYCPLSPGNSYSKYECMSCKLQI